MTCHVRTVTFIDLAGFTTATAAHGDETAADLAERLVELTNRSLGPDDQLVKGIGDAVMRVSDTPADALVLAGRICHLADHEPAFPLVRIGLHHGPVVERNHDWFGNTVNIAARLVSRAGPGQVLGSTSVTEAATRAGMDVIDLGPISLRGAPEPVALAPSRPAAPNRTAPSTQSARWPSTPPEQQPPAPETTPATRSAPLPASTCSTQREADDEIVRSTKAGPPPPATARHSYFRDHRRRPRRPRLLEGDSRQPSVGPRGQGAAQHPVGGSQ